MSPAIELCSSSGDIIDLQSTIQVLNWELYQFLSNCMFENANGFSSFRDQLDVAFHQNIA